ncbi:hypothetical protein FRX31_005935 [Thalictrum thalictroides]|uniref:Uncharacterized protein n=1 Tax=Thalictrum thalictroides TaxID=46969 RepID=A0A7J6X3W6_THATH|nr:hypothetical protein FRX31_005935 [Thalictrum thalictroides]
MAGKDISKEIESLRSEPPVPGKAMDRPKAPVSLSSLFQLGNGSKLKTTLNHFTPMFSDGVAEIPNVVIQKGQREWENYLIGSFVGKRLPYPMVKAAEPNLISSIPIWVKFEDVPKSLWSEDGLGFSASLLGKPVCLDDATANKTRLKFSKVCIEVGFNCSFPKVVKAKLKGEIIEVKVDYTWIPSKCTKCDSFGHLINRCSKKVTTYWKKNDSGPSCVRNSQGIEISADVRVVSECGVVARVSPPSSPKVTYGGADNNAAKTVLKNRFNVLQNDDEESNDNQHVELVPVLESENDVVLSNDTQNEGLPVEVMSSPILEEVTEKLVDVSNQHGEEIVSVAAQEVFQNKEGLEGAMQTSIVEPTPNLAIVVVGDENTEELSLSCQPVMVEVPVEEAIPIEEIDKFNREKEIYNALVEAEDNGGIEESEYDCEDKIEVFKDHIVKEPLPLKTPQPPPTPTHRNLKVEAKAKAQERAEKKAIDTIKKGRVRPKGPGNTTK